MRLAILALCMLTGCATVAPREQARAAVLAVAQAVHVADVQCATVALSIGSNDREAGRELATRCAVAFSVAKPALETAGGSVDAWNEGARGRVVCSVHEAGKALITLASAITAAGGRVPPAVEDGVKLLALLGECK